MKEYEYTPIPPERLNQFRVAPHHSVTQPRVGGKFGKMDGSSPTKAKDDMASVEEGQIEFETEAQGREDALPVTSETGDSTSASAIDAGEVEGTEANRTVTHEDDLDAAADLPGAAAGLELDDEDSDWDGEDPEADLDMIVNNPERFNSPIRDLEYAEGEDLNTTRVNDNHGAQGADEGGEDMRGDVTAPFMTPGEKSRAKRQGQRHPAWLPDEHYHLMRMLKESRGKKWSREKKEEVHNQKFIGTFVDRIERGHRSLDALTQQRTKLNNAKKTLKILKAEAKEYLKDPKHTLDAEGETKAAPVDLADSDDDDDDDDEDGNEEGDTTEQATHEPDEVEQGEINALNAEGAETTEGAGKAGLAGTAVGDETTKREGDVVE